MWLAWMAGTWPVNWGAVSCAWLADSCLYWSTSSRMPSLSAVSSLIA